MHLKRLVLLAQKTVESYSRDNCSQMAAAIAYHILFAIVPLVMFVVAAFGLLIGTDQVQQRITDYLSESFDLETANVMLELTESGAERLEEEYGPSAPEEVEAAFAALNSDPEREEERSALANDLLDDQPVEVAGYELVEDDVDIHFDNLVLETLRSMVSASTTLGIVSLLALGLAASGLFGQVRRSLDYVWGEPRRPPFVQGKLRNVALLLALLTLIVLTLVLVFALSVAASVLLRVVSEFRGDPGWLESATWTATAFVVPLAFSFLLFLLLYRFGPRAAVRFGDVWLGAILAAVAFEIFKFGYGVYIRNFATYDAVYGALGGVLLFLLFVYLSAQVFLYGAVLGVEYPKVRSGQYDTTADPIPSKMNLREMAISAIKSLFVSQPKP